MEPERKTDVTRLLAGWRRGDADARDRLIAAVYAELRSVAGRQLNQERCDHTLQPTALVHEAYQRLIGLDRIDWQNRAHFIGVAARLMREILVDHARRRNAAKRDGGERVGMTQLDLLAGGEAVDVADLNDALERLEHLDPGLGRLVELRYFGGLTIEETAQVLGSSPATVKRQWQTARVWLFEALADGARTPGDDAAGSERAEQAH